MKKRGDRDGADTAWGESDGNDRTRASPSPAVGNQPPPYRLEPSFYLVDRQAIPARMPPSLQQFWERNPQLLPKDALSPANFKKIPPREITPHTYSRGAPLSLVEAARQDQHFGVRYNYDVNSFDVRCVAVCVCLCPRKLCMVAVHSCLFPFIVHSGTTRGRESMLGGTRSSLGSTSRDNVPAPDTGCLWMPEYVTVWLLAHESSRGTKCCESVCDSPPPHPGVCFVALATPQFPIARSP